MDGLRALHSHNPEQFTTPVLAAQFRISPEAVRRILKSKWQPSDEARAEMLAKEREGRIALKTQRRTKEWEVVVPVPPLQTDSLGGKVLQVVHCRSR